MYVFFNHFLGDFEEFPSDARPIIRVMMSAYGKDLQDENPLDGPPQSGSNSGVTSPTNSDSGIGYRDDGDNGEIHRQLLLFLC